MDADEPVVTYTTKELLADIKKDIGEVKGLLNTKAEEVDVVAIRAKVQEMDGRLVKVETSSDSNKWTLSQIAIPLIAIAVAAAVVIFR